MPQMIIIEDYAIEKDLLTNTYKIISQEAPLCPSCGILMSGYDTRKRHCIDLSGDKKWYTLRRVQCPLCHSVHLELPDFMHPSKHYAAQVIIDTIAGREQACPADNSTIRRWKTHPHTLPRKK
ncbi:MAG: hypothetical protein IKL36_07595 [Clostridia bacterium]|nr:hypothetical protein [Clostridia bacterium]